MPKLSKLIDSIDKVIAIIEEFFLLDYSISYGILFSYLIRIPFKNNE